LEKIRKNAFSQIADVKNLEEEELLRVSLLGRKGALTSILRSLKELPEAERKKVGEGANRLRQEIGAALDEKKRQVEEMAREGVLKKEWLDVTRPGVKQERGHLHPITKVLREAISIFSAMGFEVAEGPEVETEYYNFDALNIPANHPARDMWDTFWLRSNQKEIPNPKSQIPNSSGLLLRTHTSPVQIRYMEKHNPPIRIIAPGLTYRYEATDASHDFQFWQLEGLMVDKNVSIASFKAIIQEFFSKLFKSKIKIRLRPSYFPFVEPGFEVDLSCPYCKEKGCSICKKTGWLEIVGAGMVHPDVFKAAGYNPRNVQGFAFGFGFDRIVMMKYKIPDIRFLRSGDLRFLKQF